MAYSSELAERIINTPNEEIDGRIVNPAVTQKNMNDLFRDMARWLTENPEEHIDFPLSFFLCSPDLTMQSRMTNSYLRNTMGRVPEVREGGKIAVTTINTEDGRAYRFEFKPGEFAKNKARDLQIEKARAEGARKALQQMDSMIERFNPDLSFLTSQDVTPLQAALNVQSQYKALLEDIRQRYEDGTL